MTTLKLLLLDHNPDDRPTRTQALVNRLPNAARSVNERTEPASPRAARHGSGIAERDRGRIFEVFQRLHGQESYPGTGIGLALVRKGVERMGGTLGVVSTPGAGTVFWFELPAADADA